MRIKLPFTIEEFLAVFQAYNQAIEPWQLVAYLLGIVTLVAGIKSGKHTATIILVILAVFWGWTGLVYHILFFSEINPAAYVFGGFFILHAILIVYFAVRSDEIRFSMTLTPPGIVGAIFIVYAMLIYPILNYSLGHGYPAMPVFGVTPCPLTIFTFGVFLFANKTIPWYLIVIPFIWSLIGLSAAIQLQVYEDLGLVVAALVATGLLIAKKYQQRYTA
jgi:hypothetical protein